MTRRYAVRARADQPTVRRVATRFARWSSGTAVTCVPAAPIGHSLGRRRGHDPRGASGSSRQRVTGEEGTLTSIVEPGCADKDGDEPRLARAVTGAAPDDGLRLALHREAEAHLVGGRDGHPGDGAPQRGVERRRAPGARQSLPAGVTVAAPDVTSGHARRGRGDGGEGEPVARPRRRPGRSAVRTARAAHAGSHLDDDGVGQAARHRDLAPGLAADEPLGRPRPCRRAAADRRAGTARPPVAPGPRLRRSTPRTSTAGRPSATRAEPARARRPRRRAGARPTPRPASSRGRRRAAAARRSNRLRDEASPRPATRVRGPPARRRAGRSGSGWTRAERARYGAGLLSRPSWCRASEQHHASPREQPQHLGADHRDVTGADGEHEVTGPGERRRRVAATSDHDGT